jgi:hypothetical protein
MYKSSHVIFSTSFKTAEFPIEYFVPNVSEPSERLTHLCDLSVNELQQDTLQEFTGEVRHLTQLFFYTSSFFDEPGSIFLISFAQYEKLLSGDPFGIVSSSLVG